MLRRHYLGPCHCKGPKSRLELILCLRFWIYNNAFIFAGNGVFSLKTIYIPFEQDIDMSSYEVKFSIAPINYI